MESEVSPGQFAAALQQRRLEAKRRKLIGWGVGAAALSLAALVIYLVWFSPVLTVKKIEVTGNKLLTQQQVLQVAQVSLEIPLARVDTAAIQQRIKQVPEVAQVQVERSYPNTVVIKLTERVMVYQRKTDAGYQWVDDQGVSFRTTAKPVPEKLIAITSGTDSRLLADVATVVANVPGDIRSKVSQIEAKAVDQISLKLSDGVTVIWGSADQSPLKAEVLATLLPEGAKVYDVSAPKYPTTR